MSLATIGTLPGVRPVVELGVADSREPLGTAQWEPASGGVDPFTRWQPAGGAGTASRWVGAEPTWVDVTCYVNSVETFCGRERAIDRFDVATATIVLDNRTGWADYPTTQNPLHILLSVRPGRAVRVGVTLDGSDDVQYVLWRGFIDATAPGYDAEDGSEIVTLECVCAKGDAGRAAVARLTSAVGNLETANARVGRILNAVNWPTTWRSLQASTITLNGTVMGARAVDLLDLAADSSAGAVFGDNAGRVAYRPRDWQTVPAGTPAAATIGNVGAGAICPSEWEIGFAREDISTRSIVGRPGETPRQFNDNDGRVLFGVETIERVDLETALNTDLDAIGQRYLAVRSWEQMPRIAAVTVPATSPGAPAMLATTSPYTPTLLYCRHRAADGHDAWEPRTMLCVGIEHRLDPEAWEARIALDDAAPFIVGADAGRWTTTESAVSGYWSSPSTTRKTTWSRTA